MLGCMHWHQRRQGYMRWRCGEPGKTNNWYCIIKMLLSSFHSRFYVFEKGRKKNLYCVENCACPRYDSKQHWLVYTLVHTPYAVYRSNPASRSAVSTISCMLCVVFVAYYSNMQYYYSYSFLRSLTTIMWRDSFMILFPFTLYIPVRSVYIYV